MKAEKNCSKQDRYRKKMFSKGFKAKYLMIPTSIESEFDRETRRLKEKHALFHQLFCE